MKKIPKLQLNRWLAYLQHAIKDFKAQNGGNNWWLDNISSFPPIESLEELYTWLAREHENITK